MNKFKELREASGMNCPQFAKYFEIPYRTVKGWDNGERECPEYLMKLMRYKLVNEALIRADMERSGEDG